MNITRLPADLEIFVRDEITRRHYQSEEKVLTAALSLLKAKTTRTNGDTK